mgnify:CR=1 FL=1|tara:strand:+ start:278 stop:1105 length:828 start_codon:yes stop_codon:yes gene_type:complete
MKTKHNKKRNTAFVYEALVREATVAILKNEHKKKKKVVSLIKKHFHGDSLLRRDLECYRSLYENQNLDQQTSKKILKEARMQRMMIDPTGLFKQQTALIHDVNKELTPEVYNNFVPNYKTLATIDQIFSSKTSPKNRVLMEGEVISRMQGKEEISSMSSIDNVTYRTFVKKFNKKYDNDLLGEQKNLLTQYIASFADNSLELKIFLNDEISRLKAKLQESCKLEEIAGDKEMLRKTNEIITRLESFSKEGISEAVLMTVLKTQSLVEEIYNVDNN